MPRERKNAKNKQVHGDGDMEGMAAPTKGKKRRTSAAAQANNASSGANSRGGTPVTSMEHIPPMPSGHFGEPMMATNPFDDYNPYGQQHPGGPMPPHPPPPGAPYMNHQMGGPPPPNHHMGMNQMGGYNGPPMGHHNGPPMGHHNGPPMGHNGPPPNMMMGNHGPPPPNMGGPMGHNGPMPMQHPQHPGPHPGPPPPHMMMRGPGPGMMGGKVYPHDLPRVSNPANPNAPPIYPCGICHKEVHDNDQAILCESGCNFWYHRMCTGLTEPAYSMLNEEIYAEWACDKCMMSKQVPFVKCKP